MILEGNARGYGADLARHLMNISDNDYVTVHAVDGFLADDLAGAFAEAEAIAGATQVWRAPIGWPARIVSA